MSKKIKFSIEPEFLELDKYYEDALHILELEAEQGHPGNSMLSPSAIVSIYSRCLLKCRKRIIKILNAYNHHIRKSDIISIHEYLEKQEKVFITEVKKYGEVPVYSEDGYIDSEESVHQETLLLEQHIDNFYCRCHNEYRWRHIWYTVPIIVSFISLLVAIFK